MYSIQNIEKSTNVSTSTYKSEIGDKWLHSCGEKMIENYHL